MDIGQLENAVSVESIRQIGRNVSNLMYLEVLFSPDCTEQYVAKGGQCRQESNPSVRKPDAEQVGNSPHQQTAQCKYRFGNSDT